MFTPPPGVKGEDPLNTEWFEIDERFRGPPRSGNGGYVCGRIAKHLTGTITARLMAPPPIQKALRLDSTDEQARLVDGETLIGEAKQGQLVLSPPTPPTYEAAQEASKSFLGFQSHAFPGCFVCGPERGPLDGLRIFPGTLSGTSTIAAAWTPDDSLADEFGVLKSEFVWSALDCTGGFSTMPLPEGLAIVLGELSVSITSSIKPGDRCVVLGWPIAKEGRKRFVGSALYSAEGRLLAMARAVWIEVPQRTWG